MSRRGEPGGMRENQDIGKNYSISREGRWARVGWKERGRGRVLVF